MRLNWGTAPANTLQILELCLVLLAVAIAFIRPRLGESLCVRIELALGRLSQRPWICAGILFLFPIAFRVILLPVYGVPPPVISDEFAYLLQSDTFASGRITNPTPPLPEHFTSVYILTKPTYTAEYQPAQGLALAIGQMATGVPWVGVVLSMGVLCALTYWALLPWLSSVWAFVGTLIVMDISLGVLSYWMNSYWGGCVPALGGVLTWGALPRVLGKNSFRNALLTGAGLLILFNSRPLEGVFLTLIVTGAVFCWTVRTKELSTTALLTRVVPALAVAAGVVLATAALYNWRVTKSATHFPYLLYRERYGLPQGFFWQKPVLVNTSTMPADIRSEYEDQLRQHDRRRSPKALLAATGGKVRRFWEFYVGVVLTLPLTFLPFIWQLPRMRLALWSLLIVLGGDNLLFFAFFPHYAAAVTVLIVLVLIQCLRSLRASSKAGVFLSRALPVICLVGLLVPIGGRWVEGSLSPRAAALKKLWQPEFEQNVEREAFTPALEREPGNQLVLVRYEPYDGRRKFEWVFNRADLSSAKIIWARYGRDPESNRQLVERFPDRKLWLAEPDAVPPRVTPYRLQSAHNLPQ